jgi:hypothetical protein
LCGLGRWAAPTTRTPFAHLGQFVLEGGHGIRRQRTIATQQGVKKDVVYRRAAVKVDVVSNRIIVVAGFSGVTAVARTRGTTTLEFVTT